MNKKILLSLAFFMLFFFTFATTNIYAKEKQQKALVWRIIDNFDAFIEINYFKWQLATAINEAKRLENDPNNKISDLDSGSIRLDPHPRKDYHKNPKRKLHKLFLEIRERADLYNKLGILDKILDMYFEKTETTPNSILEKCFSTGCDYSFFQIIANNAVFSSTNKTLLEKLTKRGGDANLVTIGRCGRKSSAKEDIKRMCDYYCKNESNFVSQPVYFEKGQYCSDEHKENVARARCDKARKISERFERKSKANQEKK